MLLHHTNLETIFPEGWPQLSDWSKNVTDLYCISVWVEKFEAISENYIWASLHSPKLSLVSLDLSAIMMFNRPLFQGKIGPFVLEVVII